MSTVRGFVLTNFRHRDEAIEQLRRVIASDPNMICCDASGCRGDLIRYANAKDTTATPLTRFSFALATGAVCIST